MKKPFHRKRLGHVYDEGGLDLIGCGRGGPSVTGCKCREPGSYKRLEMRMRRMREDIRVLKGMVHESKRGHMRAERVAFTVRPIGSLKRDMSHIIT
jgi:hypothetical protein